ncbi:MAG: protein-L-isoaspartate(D-aspartate) O-methyltransferase [Chitinophagales bacterium]|nr:protein-L-isoaspartate(D-aspartate) O-methyltransferase [Bacteroidota bacterium]MCB9043816.1 protein-L-isoaspartate(D-aspartate) O-methyltransferase [Chitinophagales bacterium]
MFSFSIKEEAWLVGRRNMLVKTLANKGISDQNVLRAIGTVPRHLFLESVFYQDAYEDKAMPIAQKQTISQPYTVAFQSQLLEVKPGHKVLEIGTGSGYQASILYVMGARVYTIERIKTLHLATEKFLKEKLGIFRIKCLYGDGFAGNAAYAPYDRILITAAAPEIPNALLQQLAVGGVLVIPLGNFETQQKMLRIVKKSETDFVTEEHGTFRFVPMLSGKTEQIIDK